MQIKKLKNPGSFLRLLIFHHDDDDDDDSDNDGSDDDDAQCGEGCEELGRLGGGMRHPSKSLSISKAARVGMEPHVSVLILNLTTNMAKFTSCIRVNIKSFNKYGQIYIMYPC